MKLRNVKIETANNVTSVEGATLSGDLVKAASNAAFIAGASEMAEMFRERIMARDMRGLIELARATEFDSFYGIKN
tara:strand:+ start:1401 stop:1628 length:228 start_codon:yes stop_codon:yes gene_type:complete